MKCCALSSNSSARTWCPWYPPSTPSVNAQPCERAPKPVGYRRRKSVNWWSACLTAGGDRAAMMKGAPILSKSCARLSPQSKCTRRWISLPWFWDARATPIHPGRRTYISRFHARAHRHPDNTQGPAHHPARPARSIEYLGLVKIDLLGIRGSSVLGDVENALRAQAQQGLTVLQPEKPAPGSPPPVDEEVSDMLQQWTHYWLFSN